MLLRVRRAIQRDRIVATTKSSDPRIRNDDGVGIGAPRASASFVALEQRALGPYDLDHAWIEHTKTDDANATIDKQQRRWCGIRLPILDAFTWFTVWPWK